MSYIGTRPKLNTTKYVPRSADPINPSEGEVQFADGTARTKGLWQYKDASWQQIGNATDIDNLISNSDSEQGTTGWTTYANAATSRPVDGTGGSPNITWTRTTSSPLSGQSSFLFTKDAADRIGQGVSYDFIVDLAHKAKVLNIELDYIVDSGTFVAGSSSTDSDLIVYLYDITNAILIEPSSFKLLSNNTDISDKFTASFQTSATSTDYRLIIHCATTSASAYTVKFDSIKVSASNYIYGTPITDWSSWTPTGSWVTNTAYTGRRRRVGDSEEFQVKVATSGAPTATPLTINLPVSVDTTKLVDAGTSAEYLGGGGANDSGTVYKVYAAANGSSSVGVRFQSATSGSTLQVTATSLFTFGAGDFLNLQFRVPVVGYSSSVQTSDQTDTRVVEFKATRSADQTGVNTNNTEVKMTFNQTETDTHGAFNTSTNQYVVPVSGYYVFSAGGAPLNTNILGARYNTRIYKNSIIQAQSHNPVHTVGVSNILNVTSPPIFCNVGDLVEARWFGAGNNSASTLTLQSNTEVSYLSGLRLTGPSAIAASEEVSCRYSISSGPSIPNTGENLVTFTTKLYDTHNAYNTSTGIFTAPTSGRYRVSSTLWYASATYAAANGIYSAIYKNGSIYSYGNSNAPSAAITFQFSSIINDTIDCIAGDTIQLRARNARTGGATNLSTASTENYLTIERVK